MRKTGKSNDFQFKHHQLKLLSLAIANTKNPEEALALLETVFSRSEKYDIAQRFSILQLFLSGKKYYEIEISLGTTPGTISKALDLYVKNEKEKLVFNKILKRCEFPEFKYQLPPKKTIRKSDRPHYPGAIKI